MNAQNKSLLLLLLLCCFGCSLFGQSPVIIPNYTIKEVTFSNAGVSLAGTVYKPKHPYASLVLVHGSGQETRMLKMASLLAENGIAVLTYDKRGAGQSGGVYAGPEVGTNNIDSANLQLLGSDASAAADVLLAYLPKKHGPVGLMGFSQAGWVIPIAAQKNAKLSFMILFSGPVVTALEQLRFQFYTNGNSKFWDTHTETEVREHIHSDPDRYQFADTDPRNALSALVIPGLWILGGKDIQAPVGLSMERLDIFKSQGKRYDYLLFPELGHNTAFAKSQEPVEVAVQWIKAMSGMQKGNY